MAVFEREHPVISKSLEQLGYFFQPLAEPVELICDYLKEETPPGYKYPISVRNMFISAASLGGLSVYGTAMASLLTTNAINPEYNFLALPASAAVGVGVGIAVVRGEINHRMYGKEPETPTQKRARKIVYGLIGALAVGIVIKARNSYLKS